MVWQIVVFISNTTLLTGVGCIYASKPFNSSLIYYQRLFHSNSTIKHQKQLKYISSIFLVLLLTLFPCHLYFLRYMSYEGLSHLLPSQPFDSGLRKCLPTHWLYPTIWLPDGQGAKVPGKQVYVSETHSRMSSLLSVYHHWGGEQRCHCIIYLLIFFVVCNLGSIYSHIQWLKKPFQCFLISI